MKLKIALLLLLSMVVCKTNGEMIKPKAIYPVHDISAAQYEAAANYVADEVVPAAMQRILNTKVFELYDPTDHWYAEYERVRASSSLAQQGRVTYYAQNAADYDHETVWCEGVAGYGVGQYIEYTFSEYHPRITEVKILNGYVKSLTQWQKNSRVKRLRVYFNGKALTDLELEDSRTVQVFDLGTVGYGPNGRGKGSWTLRFEIVDVYPGTHYQDTVISEIYFNGIDMY